GDRVNSRGQACACAPTTTNAAQSARGTTLTHICVNFAHRALDPRSTMTFRRKNREKVLDEMRRRASHCARGETPLGGSDMRKRFRGSVLVLFGLSFAAHAQPITRSGDLNGDGDVNAGDLAA